MKYKWHANFANTLTEKTRSSSPLATKLAELALVGAVPGVGEYVLLQTLLVSVGGVAERASVRLVSGVRAAVSGNGRLGVSAVSGILIRILSMDCR